MGKGLNRLIACALAGTITLGGNGILANAAFDVPLAGGALTIEEAIAANVDIIANITPIVKTEYDLIAIAQVDTYVNIRDEASEEGNILGKIYNNAAGKILAVEGDWYLIESGSVKGYVKSEYFATGEDAEALAAEVGTTYATVNTETLYVRAEATTESDILAMVGEGNKLSVLETTDGWAKVAVDSDVVGYISLDFAEVDTEFAAAESKEEEEEKIRIEEERLRLEEEQRLQEEEAQRQSEADAAAETEAPSTEAEVTETEAPTEAEVTETEAPSTEAEVTETEAPQTEAPQTEAPQTEAPQTEAPQTEAPQTEAPAASSSGQSIVDYAVQFVGNPYVWGGTSLTNGADCSGFTQSVMAHFGISIPRTAAAQAGSGTQVSLSDIQAGDLLFYSSGSGISHVAIYMGNGKVVHASSSTTGIIISDYSYRQPVSASRYY